MRIVSWNVNGLRAVHKNGFWGTFLREAQADVICLQETKADEAQLPEELRIVPGYRAYFSSSKLRKGYSGVAIYTKDEPDEVFTGMGTPRFDDEGRIVGVRFDGTVILNIYFPNGGQGPERLAYKLEFYDEFLAFIERIKDKGYNVIFCGDVNTAHEAIDLAHPERYEDSTGFLPEERAWIDQVINSGFDDVWRHLNPNKAGVYTYWDTRTRARDRNDGWRLDYFFVNRALLHKVVKMEVLSAVYGSDHCPIALDITV